MVYTLRDSTHVGGCVVGLREDNIRIQMSVASWQVERPPDRRVA